MTELLSLIHICTNFPAKFQLQLLRKQQNLSSPNGAKILRAVEVHPFYFRKVKLFGNRENP